MAVRQELVGRDAAENGILLPYLLAAKLYDLQEKPGAVLDLQVANLPG